MTRLLGRLLALWVIWKRGIRGPVPGPPAPEIDPRSRELPEDERAELLVAALLFASAAFAVAFLVVYVVSSNTPLLGTTAGLALACVAAALMLASLRVVPQETAVQEREVLLREEEDEAFADELRAGTDGVSRRGLLVTAAGACTCGLGLVALAPAASMGPRVGDRLASSPWKDGLRLVDEQDRPVTADTLSVDGIITAFPEGAQKGELGSPVVVVRVDPAQLRLPPDRRDWAPEGLLAYSKICTHAGCAVSEYRAPLSDTTAPGGPALVCPCHYSTFDVTRAAKVVFGPAGRPLPQLPLRIGPGRTLLAGGPLSGIPGPAWWGVKDGGA